MDLKKSLEQALIELRKGKKRNFQQTVDLIINLKKFDVKKDAINILIQIPHKFKEKKICGFLETKNKNIHTITKEEFKKYSDKKELKKLAKNFDFFISQASLMPSVATTFGRVLGPLGKMPSPQLGIVVNVDDKVISGLKDKKNRTIKIRTKEPSLKIAVGKEDMKDEEIIENALAVYNSILKALPKAKENLKNIQIKFTMTKPQKINLEK